MRLPAHSLRAIPCALVMCGAVCGQSIVPIPATLNSNINGAASPVSNCTAISPPSGCTNVTLSNNASVTIQSQTSVVLGPNFTAVGSANSQLLIQVVPLTPTITTSSGTTLPGAGPSAAIGLSASSPYWNSNGVVQLLINTQWQAAHACYVEYVQASNAFYILSDDASQWLTTTNTNSQCSLLSSSSANQSGNNLNVTFNLSFNPSFSGNMQVWAVSYDGNGESSEWQQLGTWYAGNVPITLTTNPPGLTIQVDGNPYLTPQTPALTQGSHTLTVQSPQTNGIQYVFTNWSDGPTSNPRNITVDTSPSAYTANFIPVDFAVSITNSAGNSSIANVPIGGTTVFTLTTSSSNGFNPANTPISWTASGLPSGAIAAFSATSNPNQTSMTVTAPTAGTGGFIVTATGTAENGLLSHSASGTVVIQDFTLTVAPAPASGGGAGQQTVVGGQTANYIVTANSINGFSTPVTLSFFNNDCDSGGQTYFSQMLLPSTIIPGDSPVTLALTTVSVRNEAVCHSLEIAGGSGSITHQAYFGMTILPAGNVTVDVSPPVLTVQPTPGSATYNVTVTSINNYGGNVALFLYGLPPGATTSGFPSSVAVPTGQASSFSFTINVPAAAQQGAYPLQIGTSVGTAAGYATLNIGAGPGFTISTSPPQTAPPGGSAQYTITVGGSASGNVQLSATPSLSGATVQFNPQTGCRRRIVDNDSSSALQRVLRTDYRSGYRDARLDTKVRNSRAQRGSSRTRIDHRSGTWSTEFRPDTSHLELRHRRNPVHSLGGLLGRSVRHLFFRNNVAKRRREHPTVNRRCLHDPQIPDPGRMATTAVHLLGANHPSKFKLGSRCDRRASKRPRKHPEFAPNERHDNGLQRPNRCPYYNRSIPSKSDK